jgi:hypothetical protein
VLDVPASNTHGFLLRDICISSTELYRPIWKIEGISPHWKTHVAGIIPFKTNTVSQGNNGVDSAASNMDNFLWRGTYVSSTLLNIPNWSKQCLYPP